METIQLNRRGTNTNQSRAIDSRGSLTKGKTFSSRLVIADKLVNREMFKTTMHEVWKPQGKVDFKEVGSNLFLVELKSPRPIESPKRTSLDF